MKAKLPAIAPSLRLRAQSGKRSILPNLLLIVIGITFALPASAGWTTQWIDKFDGNGVDWNNWTAQTEANYNNEVQCYTADDSSADKNYAVSAGTLTIIARRQFIDCPHAPLGDRTWSSGRLNSKDKREFLYGRLESRIRVLDTKGGSWPAFWMLENQIFEQPIKGDGSDNVNWPNPGAGEIDVWEWFSNDSSRYITNFFNASPGCSSGNVVRYTYGALDVTQWHDYAIEWDADVARFYIDDILVRTQNLSSCGQYEEPMFVLLNVAIGGNLGGAIDGGLSLARMEIDYVAHCTATNSNSAARCNESTPGSAQNLFIFADFERADWAAWDSAGGTAPMQVVDGDMTYDEVMEFDIVGSTVVGFTSRAPFATGGIPYDASEVVNTATLEFDLKMTALPTTGTTDWKLKIESPGAATAVEVSLTSSLEGHPTPELDTWQRYSFKLADLQILGLDVSAIDLVLVFPEFGTGNGAAFRLDNVKILTNVAQNPGTTDNTPDDIGSAFVPGGGGGGGGSSGLLLFMALGGLMIVRRARRHYSGPVSISGFQACGGAGLTPAPCRAAAWPCRGASCYRACVTANCASVVSVYAPFAPPLQRLSNRAGARARPGDSSPGRETAGL
jgi:beta-glucanase (GH16 family)